MKLIMKKLWTTQLALGETKVSLSGGVGNSKLFVGSNWADILYRGETIKSCSYMPLDATSMPVFLFVLIFETSYFQTQ
jgi:hypothetical protein